jgi:hypothetical protein
VPGPFSVGNETGRDWVDPPGTARLAGWSSGVTHFGVMSQGRFTPLPTPPGIALGTLPDIAR